jgi:ATP-binding cassette, subfamily B, multidrug efflux pump
MIKKLLACVGEFKKDSILTPIYVTLEAVMEVIIPLLMATLIDKGINVGNMSVVWKIGAILVVSGIISLMFGALAGRTAAIASSGFARNLRRKIYYTVQDFSFSNIDKFSTASLITRMTTDVANVQNAFQMIIRIAVRSPALLIFALVMAFTISSKLALVFLITVPLLGGGLIAIILTVHPTFERVFRTYDKLNNVVQENLRGIRVVKSFVREDYEKDKFFKISNAIYKDFSYAEKILAFNSPMMQAAMYTCMLMISWFGAKLIVGTEMTEGQLVSMMTYAMQILNSLMMFSMVFVMTIISRASAERITQVLDEKSDLANPPHPVMQVANGDVTFKNVSFSYSKKADKPALSGIDLDIRSGETIGVLGVTGSSKTSLLQLIPRLYDVTSGSVMVGGVDVRQYDIETLRQQVAMVLQKNVLFSGTIRDNLRWGNPTATDEELTAACQLAQADGFIRSFAEGYDTMVEQGGTNLSGGQKQRLCIARALLKNPKILILDDSTSAVDTNTDAQIRKAFREAIPHVTKFIITQRISSIEDADKIIVMESGRIAAVGTHQQLLKENPIYQEVFNSQTKGGA